MTPADFGQVLASLRAEMVWDPTHGLALIEGRWVAPAAAELALRDWIYARYFCRWQAPAQATGYTSGDSAFVAGLHDATSGACYWEPGWHVISRSADGEAAPWAFVGNGRLTLFIDTITDLSPVDAPPESAVLLRLPCARANLAPGFFYLFGRAGAIRREEPYVRLYLNIAPGDTAAAIAYLLAGLDVPFEAKFANDPAAYGRVDPAVVYVEARHYDTARTYLLDWGRRRWREGTPLFTYRLAAGLAAAESPLDGSGALESYGQHRCRLMAEGILTEEVGGETSVSAWLEGVRLSFRAAGIDLAYPYVQHLSSDILTARGG